MKIAMIGLGRMGAPMVGRLLRAGHACVVHGRQPEVVDRLVAEGAQAAASLADQIAALDAPRVVWLMVPAGAVDEVVDRVLPHLARGDIVVDGGNSFHGDDIRRAAALAERGLHHVDAGVSGGVWGATRGYCLMLGGESAVVERLAPLFEALAPGAPDGPAGGAAGTSVGGSAARGWLHCGPHGAGHFVKMVHNGIEYGTMAALAEGFNLLHHAGAGRDDAGVDAETAPLRDASLYRYDFDLPAIAELWRHGSVIGSWLLDLSAQALADDPALVAYEGRVSDSGEGRWTVQAAVDLGVPAAVIGSALYARFASRGGASFGDRTLSAMRHAFGGHLEKTAGRVPGRSRG
jgi:6-phosphogluconate dehydrogenase